MNNKELLELAAKAVNQPIEFTDGVPVSFIENGVVFAAWNPLNDDGDALRLAVKLLLDVTFSETHAFAFPPEMQDGCFELINVGDPYAATRRAIVRAAAEIGKAML